VTTKLDRWRRACGVVQEPWHKHPDTPWQVGPDALTYVRCQGNAKTTNAGFEHAIAIADFVSAASEGFKKLVDLAVAIRDYNSYGPLPLDVKKALYALEEDT
jgi:hypothetical protein